MPGATSIAIGYSNLYRERAPRLQMEHDRTTMNHGGAHLGVNVLGLCFQKCLMLLLGLFVLPVDNVHTQLTASQPTESNA